MFKRVSNIIESFNPATKEFLGSIEVTSSHEIADIIAKCRIAFLAWAERLQPCSLTAEQVERYFAKECPRRLNFINSRAFRLLGFPWKLTKTLEVIEY